MEAPSLSKKETIIILLALILIVTFGFQINWAEATRFRCHDSCVLYQHWRDCGNETPIWNCCNNSTCEEGHVYIDCYCSGRYPNAKCVCDDPACVVGQCGAECDSNADCDDGDSSTGDTCEACSCFHCDAGADKTVNEGQSVQLDSSTSDPVEYCTGSCSCVGVSSSSCSCDDMKCYWVYGQWGGPGWCNSSVFRGSCSCFQAATESCCTAHGCSWFSESLTYSWSCTGGSLDDSSKLQPVYTASEVSADTNYTCTLTVSDSHGATCSDSMTVTVKNVNIPPTCDAGPDKEVFEGQSIVLEGSTNCGDTGAPCPACQYCNASGSCTAVPNNNWGADLYWCTGSTSRCYGGVCRTCSGSDVYLTSDGCDGCTGQGGQACWVLGESGQSCDQACASRGGCVNRNWNDVEGCPVCKHWYTDWTNCWTATWEGSPAAEYPYEACGKRYSPINQDCSTYGGVGIYTRFCLCQF